MSGASLAGNTSRVLDVSTTRTEARDTLGRSGVDVATAQLANVSKVACFFVVSAIVYRSLGPQAYGLLVMIRATAGLLQYVTLGLTPAVVRHLAAGEHPANEVYATSVLMSAAAGLVAMTLAALYALGLGWLHDIPSAWLGASQWVAFGIAAGVVLRLISGVPAAVLRTRDRIWLDNLLVAASEVLWPLGVLLAVYLSPTPEAALAWVGLSFFGAKLFLLLTTYAFAEACGAPWRLTDGRRRVVGPLLLFGSAVLVGQLAGVFDAPIDLFLINRFVDPDLVPDFGAATQLASATALIVASFAQVLFPRAAVAAGKGDVALLWRYWLIGTAAAVAFAAAVSVVVLASSHTLLRLWIDDVPAWTPALLWPLMTNTVFVAAAGVGSAVLLGIGRANAQAASVLVAAVANAAISVTFVMFGFGLWGIVAGTLLATFVRGAIWQPWYIVRCLRREAERVEDARRHASQ